MAKKTPATGIAWSEGLLNAALVGAAVLLLVLLYGFLARAFQPRTVPLRDGGADRVQVEVRNAAGADGIAATTTAFLRRRGFDVIETSNAREQRDLSAVVVRAGTPEYARRVAGALRIDAARVETAGTAEDYDPDVTVLLGRDYQTLSPFDAP